MKRFSTLLAALILVVSAATAQDVDYWDGSASAFSTENNAGESAENPILIESAAQLAYLAQQVNAITDYNLYEGKYFKLTKNLDLDNQEWTPIGWHFTNAYNRHFKGNLDGAGHTIANLAISDPYMVPHPTAGNPDVNCSTYGLFGAIEGAARGALYLKNLGIVSGRVSGTGSVAAFAAWSCGVAISQCFNKATLEGTSYVGGITAYPVSPSSDVINCYNMGSAKITATATANKAVGGLIGSTTTAWITNSYNFGDVIVNGSIPAGAWGGVTGVFQSTRQPVNTYYVSNCVSNGNSYGTSVSEATMMSPTFVLDINNDQDPAKWSADKNNTNFGLPVLMWEIDPTSLGLHAVQDAALLSQNSPNPFDVNSQITLTLVAPGEVSLKVYNLSGQEVGQIFAGALPAGNHNFTINALDYPAGMYSYRLVTGAGSVSKKMIVK